MMHLNAEQTELRAVVRQFLTARSPESVVREQMASEDGFDRRLWEQLSELALPGLLVPESMGGCGGTLLDLAVVLEEMGMSLLCAPFFSTAVLGVLTLLEAGDLNAQNEYLPKISNGSMIATLAVHEPDGRWDAADTNMVGHRRGDTWRISGTKSFVLDGTIADLILVPARTHSGLSLFAVSGDALSINKTALETLDLTRKQARLEFDDVDALLLGEEGSAQPVIDRTLDIVAIALSVEQVGGAAACLDMAVDYAKVRHQFGRPIGSFQAIKHRCADMLVDVESARAAAYLAVEAIEETRRPLMASVASAVCSDSYLSVAAENIQIHGGIGFTWEHPAHLYFRRARASSMLFGDPTHHRRRAAQLLGL